MKIRQVVSVERNKDGMNQKKGIIMSVSLSKFLSSQLYINLCEIQRNAELTGRIFHVREGGEGNRDTCS